MKSGEAASEEPAPEERAELILDEPGQPFAVPEPSGLGAERFEVIADDGVQDRGIWVPRRVLALAHTTTPVPTACQGGRS